MSPRAVGLIGRVTQRVAETYLGMLAIQQGTITLLRQEVMTLSAQTLRVRDIAQKNIGDLQKELVRSRNSGSALRKENDELRTTLTECRKQHDETYDLLRTSHDPLNAPLVDVARARLREFAIANMAYSADEVVTASELPPDSEPLISSGHDTPIRERE